MLHYKFFNADLVKLYLPAVVLTVMKVSFVHVRTVCKDISLTRPLSIQKALKSTVSSSPAVLAFLRYKAAILSHNRKKKDNLEVQQSLGSMRVPEKNQQTISLTSQLPVPTFNF